MELWIDGLKIIPQADRTLLDLIRQLGLDSEKLSQRPLAAKIAGEVFTLNYIPVRSRDISEERVSIRRAMAASGGKVSLLRYRDATGKETYTRTAQFLIFLALRMLWPQAVGKMNCTVGSGLYISVMGADNFDVPRLKEKMLELTALDFPLVRRRVTREAAIRHFEQDGQPDKVRLLKWRKTDYFDEYSYGDYADYFYGEMMPSSGFLQSWDILPAKGGFMFIFPDEQNPDRISDFMESPNFFKVFQEGEHWCRLMECATVSDLNDLVLTDNIRELIRVNEALHEKRYSQIADQICSRGSRVVMLAGPSSSGKTTSANRLATQLKIHGKCPVIVSLDNYYIDRELVKPGPDGTIDFEHINTIDVDLFRKQMQEILHGREVELPVFNFLNGRREWSGRKLRLKENTIIITEGLHGLNPILLPEGVSPNMIFKMSVSPMLPLNLDYHNRIGTSYLRLLRRIVRDYETRGASVEKTMSMWDSVRRGERRWIFPYQEQADVIFNSSTLYELAVLKKHIYPLLTAVGPENTYYEQVRAVVKILNYIQEADVDDEIPPTSLVREFIGGNTFYR